MDVTIPMPNTALAQVLMGEPLRRILQDRADTAALLAYEQVAKRTGAEARSAHAHVEIGGVDNDRLIGVTTLGNELVDYAASHQFGTRYQAGAHDLNAVLEQLGSL